jgi:hypothetical protein
MPWLRPSVIEKTPHAKETLMTTVYVHIPHPHAKHRTAAGPVKVADQHPQGNAVARFNTRLALVITTAVGSMWCAYIFAALDLISLPDAINTGTAAIISWIAQTFLQLVLLSIIMVGQNVQAAAADKRSEATFTDVELMLHEFSQLQVHLAAQDALILATTGQQLTRDDPQASA